MANNENINKVVYGNTTLIDLTEDSVTPQTLLEGETAHDRSGAQITGTAKQGHTIWNAIKTALTQRSKLWFADAKATDDTTEQATKIEVVQIIDDESDLDNAPDGIYQGDYDDEPEYVLDASMVAYGNGSVEDAIDELNAEMDVDLSDTSLPSTTTFNELIQMIAEKLYPMWDAIVGVYSWLSSGSVTPSVSGGVLSIHSTKNIWCAVPIPNGVTALTYNVESFSGPPQINIGYCDSTGTFIANMAEPATVGSQVTVSVPSDAYGKYLMISFNPSYSSMDVTFAELKLH